jgi:hypothetical protein
MASWGNSLKYFTFQIVNRVTGNGFEIYNFAQLNIYGIPIIINVSLLMVFA